MPINPLRKYLASRRRKKDPPALGDLPEALMRIRFGVVDIKGQRLGCGDPSQVPSGVSVESGRGSYELEAECLAYAGDARVARVLAKRTDSLAARGNNVGRITVDLARACFFDAELLELFARDRPNDYCEWIEDHVVMCDWVEAGTLSCRQARTTLPYFEVGFGDGLYDVFELREGDSLVGLELVCLEAEAPYPFDAPPGTAVGSLGAQSDGTVEVPDLQLLVGSFQKAAAGFTGSETIEEMTKIAQDIVEAAFNKDRVK
jgi:hypothetical protein